MESIIDELKRKQTLSDEGFLQLITCTEESTIQRLQSTARDVATKEFGNAIYIRGLIEVTNFCKNDCYYCGIRKSNRMIERYRLSEEQILQCCKTGYMLGFRTFVLQGGDDPYFTNKKIESLVKAIKRAYSDCAITLSFGERSQEGLELFKKAGADRYLLRHETADAKHYAKLHPSSLSLQRRKECLYTLKKLGYQTGTGFMVGSPYQTSQTILKDLRFVEQLKPAMVGIGPYLPHRDTPFCDMPKGSLELTLKLLAILRLMNPKLLLPSTTALGTIDKEGRELGILAGANVVMPNLSPVDVRSKYSIYDNKIATKEEAAENKNKLDAKVRQIGYQLVTDRGDYRGFD